MNSVRRLGEWSKRHFLPSEANAYRPNSLSRDVLLAAVTLTCVIEGFLVASLFIQNRPGSFAAAVLESALVSLTNGERVAYGDTELRVDPLLTQAAQAKAEDMAAKGYFAHVSPSGEEPWKWFTDAGYDYAYAGENLATRFYESSDVVQAWMNSPGHRANILKGVYQDIGIGIAQGMYQGQQTTFVVQFFGTSRAELGIAPSTPAPAPTVATEAQPTRTVAKKTVSKASSDAQAAPAVAAPKEETLTKVAAEIPVTAQAPLVEGQSVSLAPHPQVPQSIARMLASPRTGAIFMLGAIVAFLLVALLLTILVRIHIQPMDLIFNGAVVALFTLAILSANLYFLSGVHLTDDTAAAIQAIAPAQ